MASAGSTCVEKIGRFEVYADEKHKLGMGATGNVYLGKDLSTNDPIAAKKMTIESEFLEEGEFEMEAELLLHKIPAHDNIIKVHDFIKIEYEDDRINMMDLWLIMDLSDLGNLKKYARKNKLSAFQKLDIMYQSAVAVHHLHNCKPQKIVHRDIKPENILLTPGPKGLVVKLCDFGTAKLVQRKGSRSVTLKSLAGTNEYMAPEQLELHDGQFSYDSSVDIFSLGLTNLSLLECSEGSFMEVLTSKDVACLCYIHTAYIAGKDNLSGCDEGLLSTMYIQALRPLIICVIYLCI